jgi:NAD(P)-dependent dehydrogenase (short-subunit alcohol dehydrogenase family)
MKTAQHPIGSGFDAETTAAEITADHDLTGKIAIVTGGNSGIGLETVKALADAGAQVVVGARGARVVVVSSIGHRHGGLRLDDINFDKRPYSGMKAYGQSKTANVLFAVEVDKIGQPYGIRAFALHPGAIETDVFRYMTEQELEDWKKGVKRFKTPQQGAATTVWCAISEQLDGKGGVYCENCDIANLVPGDAPPGPGVRAYAIDPVQAEALWQFSEAATGVHFS